MHLSISAPSIASNFQFPRHNSNSLSLLARYITIYIYIYICHQANPTRDCALMTRRHASDSCLNSLSLLPEAANPQFLKLDCSNEQFNYFHFCRHHYSTRLHFHFHSLNSNYQLKLGPLSFRHVRIATSCVENVD